MTPNGAAIQNPAFDVTPAKYITAIITEHGVLRAPYDKSIREMFESSQAGADDGVSRVSPQLTFG